MRYDKQFSEKVLTTNTTTSSTTSINDELSSATPDNYNNYNIPHGTGRFLSPEQCESIRQAYVDNISDTMTGAVARMIEDAFKHGLEADEIVMAIEETGFAPRPSPWYLKKILISIHAPRAGSDSRSAQNNRVFLQKFPSFSELHGTFHQHARRSNVIYCIFPAPNRCEPDGKTMCA